MLVGVMASGDETLARKHERLAIEVGTAIAELGYHLLTGGGGGLMKAVGQAFLEGKRNLAVNQPTGSLISIPESKRVPGEKERKTKVGSKR